MDTVAFTRRHEAWLLDTTDDACYDGHRLHKKSCTFVQH